MLDYSGIQLVRRMGEKLDLTLRQELIRTYYPFRKIPCFLHRGIDFIRRKTKKLPLIIEFEEGGFELGLDEIKGSNCPISNEFHSISCCSTSLSMEKMEQILDSCNHIKRIYYDSEVTTLLDTATPAINSDQLQGNGLTGKDVTIAVIDTGIEPHPDLQGRIVGFRDFINNRAQPYDDNGHGTHCAGDAAGDGAASNGRYKGPAPEANLVGVKVMDKMGSGSLSTVIAGVQWCIDNRSRLGIDILSLSLGSRSNQSAAYDPVVRIVERAWDDGIVICAAAGNEGPYSRTIASPGTSPRIITIGAVDNNQTEERSDDSVAVFSSRGPTIDGLTKPDLLVPGVDIISLRAPRSYIDRTNRSSLVNDYYIAMSGTSMATPICAGVVAQLLQKDPNLTPNQVKERLLDASEDLGLPPNIQGRGQLNAANLID